MGRRSFAFTLSFSFLLGLVIAVVACSKGEEGSAPSGSASVVAIRPKGTVMGAAENDITVDGGGARKVDKAATGVGQRVEIPSGKVTLGSTPGDKGRDPTLEPAMVEVEIGAFAIDKYLYPNDPAKPPLTSVSRARAAELCQKASGRLCTEIEWERACKGPDETAFAGGAQWDVSCAADPSSCASGFGVLGMGGALREWSASDVIPAGGSPPREDDAGAGDAPAPANAIDVGRDSASAGRSIAGAAVRGARKDAVAHEHRCARRAAVDPAVSSDDIGFRCCYGPPNAAVMPVPKWQQTYRRAELPASQIASMIAGVPHLDKLDKDITYFKEPDDVQMVLARGDAGVSTVPNTSFTTSPMLWSPVPGEEILVVAGRSGKHAFIVAFYRLPGDRYRIGSSLLLKDEKGPIILGYNAYIRRRLSWARSWDTRAESGFVSYREDHRVVITQK